MKHTPALLITAALCLGAAAAKALAGQDDFAAVERQFRELPMESRRLLGPLFFIHGDESPERLRMYVARIAEGGNGCFTVESRPHSDWLGPGWFRDLKICLEAAKKHNLKMWIFDEKWFPSQVVDGKIPRRYVGKRLQAAAVDTTGPRTFAAAGYRGDRYIAAVAGRLAADGRIDGDSLVDLAPHIRAGQLSWQVPAGKWKIMKFTYAPEPTFLRVDGASKDCVHWFLGRFISRTTSISRLISAARSPVSSTTSRRPAATGDPIEPRARRGESGLEEGIRGLQVRLGRRRSNCRPVSLISRPSRKPGAARCTAA